MEQEGERSTVALKVPRGFNPDYQLTTKSTRTSTLRKIREEEKSQDFDRLKMAPFQREVREIVKLKNNDVRMTKDALNFLRETTEIFMISYFQDVKSCVNHRDAKTVKDSDILLVREITKKPTLLSMDNAAKKFGMRFQPDEDDYI